VVIVFFFEEFEHPLEVESSFLQFKIISKIILYILLAF
jgi:hypothetical protein